MQTSRHPYVIGGQSISNQNLEKYSSIKAYLKREENLKRFPAIAKLLNIQQKSW